MSFVKFKIHHSEQKSFRISKYTNSYSSAGKINIGKFFIISRKGSCLIKWFTNWENTTNEILKFHDKQRKSYLYVLEKERKTTSKQKNNTENIVKKSCIPTCAANHKILCKKCNSMLIMEQLQILRINNYQNQNY